jgi:hypothetical protein
LHYPPEDIACRTTFGGSIVPELTLTIQEDRWLFKRTLNIKMETVPPLWGLHPSAEEVSRHN